MAGALIVEQADGDVLLEARRVSGRALSGGRAASVLRRGRADRPAGRATRFFAAVERIGVEEEVAVPTFADAGDGNLHPSVAHVDR